MKHFTLFVIAIAFVFNAYADGLQEVHKSQKSFDDINTIEVNGDFCKVVLNPSDNKTVTVEANIKASEDIDGFSIDDQVSENKLSLSVVTPSRHVSTKSGEIVITVPANTILKIKNRSGYIEAENIIDCTVDAKASYGQISADNISGEYDFETSTGVISLNDIDGQINAKSSSGKIEILSAKGNLDIISNKGELLIQNTEGTVTTQTNTGNQTFESINGDVKVRTSTGEILVEKMDGHLVSNNDDGDLNIENFEGTMDLTAIAGNLVGKGVLLTGNSSYETTKGRIEMELKNNEKELSYDLASNYGFLYIPGKSKKKKLKSGKGPIQITARSNNGAQRFQLAEE